MTLVENETDDSLDPLAYAHRTLDPAKVLAELGFKHGGCDVNELDFWIKKLDERIVVSVNVDNQTGLVNYRKVRLAEPNNLRGEFTVVDSAFNVPVMELRKLMAQKTEAQEVIYRLLDNDPDAFDPRAELDRILPGKCPECGSHNISNEADDEGLLDCMNCGIWWNPLHPANAPNVPGNYPDPAEHARQHPIIDYPIDAQGNRRPPGWKPPYYEESIEDEDDPQEFIKRLAVPQPRICTSFSQTTPESSAQGDASDHGWIDEEGVEMTPDDIDAEDGLTTVDLAVKFLSNEGAIHASSSHFHPGVWYSTDYHTIDYRNGTDEERCFHLTDFAEAEEQAIWDKLQLLWRRR